MSKTAGEEYIERFYGKRHDPAYKRKNCGPRFKDREYECPRCEAWKLYDMGVEALAQTVRKALNDHDVL